MKRFRMWSLTSFVLVLALLLSACTGVAPVPAAPAAAPAPAADMSENPYWPQESSTL